MEEFQQPVYGEGQEPAPDGNFISDKQRESLTELISKVKNQLSTIDANRFAGKQMTELSRKRILAEVFQQIQAAGVDLSDQSSVSKFLSEMKEKTPELATMFEESISFLLGDSTPEEPGDEIDNNMNNINQDEILSEEVRGNM